MVSRREKLFLMVLGIALISVGIVSIVLSLYLSLHSYGVWEKVWDPQSNWYKIIWVETPRLYPYRTVGILLILIGVGFVVLGIFIRVKPTQIVHPPPLAS